MDNLITAKQLNDAFQMAAEFPKISVTKEELNEISGVTIQEYDKKKGIMVYLKESCFDKNVLEKSAEKEGYYLSGDVRMIPEDPNYEYVSTYHEVRVVKPRRLWFGRTVLTYFKGDEVDNMSFFIPFKEKELAANFLAKYLNSFRKNKDN